MKKSLCKIISVILTVIMLLPSAMVFTSAATAELQISEVSDTQACAPVFELKKISETPTELTVNIALKSGGFVCFDATLTAEGLTCASIGLTEEFKNYLNAQSLGGELSVDLHNIANGKFSLAATGGCQAPIDIVTYKFTKTSANGVTASALSLTVDSCYAEIDGADVEVTDSVSVQNSLPAEHYHTAANEWTVISKPTCTEAGKEALYCTECGEIAEEREIPATNHPNTKQEHNDASCTEDGYDRTICTDCGAVVIETVIPATGHQHTALDKKAATCTEDGYVKTICTDCGELVKEVVLPATGHKYITDVKDATCHEEGYIIIKCSVCGYVSTSTVLAKTNHSWTDWVVIKEATSHSVGLKRRSCRICGDIQEEIIPVIYVPVSNITISMNKISINYKKDTQIYADVTPEDAAYTNEIKWTTSDKKVATVDNYGNIHAVGIGTAVITASSGDCSAKCEVTVTYSTLQWLIIIFLFGWIWY